MYNHFYIENVTVNIQFKLIGGYRKVLIQSRFVLKFLLYAHKCL